jgi:chemotaxis protein methyltransferase CheR
MAISASGFDYLRQLVYRRSAIVLERGKEYLVESRLGPIARAEGFENIEALIGTLQKQQWTGLHTKVLESMTTNETSFFRDMHPFDALRETVIPALARGRSAGRPLTFWCAACSTGQEPYSIAILLREHFPELTRARAFRIVATDLSTAMLERARLARYKQAEVNRGLPAPLLLRYFERVDGDYQLSTDIRAMVEFRQLNLAASWDGVPTSDIVFLRNVLIYFDVETKKRILTRARGSLSPGGHLFLGTAETTFNLEDAFTRVQTNKAVYYRLDGKGD